MAPCPPPAAEKRRSRARNLHSRLGAECPARPSLRQGRFVAVVSGWRPPGQQRALEGPLRPSSFGLKKAPPLGEDVFPSHGNPAGAWVPCVSATRA